MARIDDILNDPDFRALPPERQDAFIDEMRQKDFGKIPPSENVLQRAVNIGGKTAMSTLGQMIPGQDVPLPFFTKAATGIDTHALPTMTSEARQMKEKGIEGLTSGIKNPFLRFGASVGLDPETYIGGGGAAKQRIPQEVGEATSKGLSSVIKKVSSLPKTSFFKNPEKGKKIAEEANAATDKVFKSFDKEYDSVLNNSPEVKLPETEVSKVQDRILEQAQGLEEGSPAYREIMKFGESLSNMTGKQLHNAKQALFKASKRLTGADRYAMRETYHAASDALSSPDVYGDAYKAVSGKFRNFIQDEFQYVEDNIIDKFNKPTEQYLTQKTPLTLNEEEAFRKLGAREQNPFVERIQGIKRGEKYKKGIPVVGRFL